MEKMTATERKTLRELQAKEKRVARAEAEFLKEADARQLELIQRWNTSDRLADAAKIVGTDPDSLYEWITQPEQIDYYRRKHPAYDASEIA